MLITRDLVAMFKTVAKLSEYGSHDDAYTLLKSIDRIAIGLEHYHEPLYQFARHKLTEYIDYCYNNDIEFHNTIMWVVHYAEIGECEKAWQSMDRLTKLTTRGKLGLLHEAESVVKAHCHNVAIHPNTDVERA